MLSADFIISDLLCDYFGNRSVSINISVLNLFHETFDLSRSGRRRKIIIHVPVKVKQQKHTHTLVKPLHVHHKQTVIKEEKVIKQEIHKPTYHTKEIIQQPIEVHHEVVKEHKPIFHDEHHEIAQPHEIKEHKPIFQEEISHEHLHHHYKV